MTLVEEMGARLRDTLPPGDGIGKSTLEATFIAMQQPGSLVRVTIDDVRHIDVTNSVTTVLDNLGQIDWEKTHAQFDVQGQDDKVTLELFNGSAIEFFIPDEIRGFDGRMLGMKGK